MHNCTAVKFATKLGDKATRNRSVANEMKKNVKIWMHETKRSYKSYFRKFFICFDFFKYVSHVSSLYESI